MTEQNKIQGYSVGKAKLAVDQDEIQQPPAKACKSSRPLSQRLQPETSLGKRLNTKKGQN